MYKVSLVYRSHSWLSLVHHFLGLEIKTLSAECPKYLAVLRPLFHYSSLPSPVPLLVPKIMELCGKGRELEIDRFGFQLCLFKVGYLNILSDL